MNKYDKEYIKIGKKIAEYKKIINNLQETLENFKNQKNKLFQEKREAMDEKYSDKRE